MSEKGANLGIYSAHSAQWPEIEKSEKTLETSLNKVRSYIPNFWGLGLLRIRTFWNCAECAESSF